MDLSIYVLSFSYFSLPLFVSHKEDGEVSLEDMMVLGGFPVLGSSVLSPLHSPELVETEKNLEEVRKELILAKADNHTR